MQLILNCNQKREINRRKIEKRRREKDMKDNTGLLCLQREAGAFKGGGQVFISRGQMFVKGGQT